MRRQSHYSSEGTLTNEDFDSFEQVPLDDSAIEGEYEKAANAAAGLGRGQPKGPAVQPTNVGIRLRTNPSSVVEIIHALGRTWAIAASILNFLLPGFGELASYGIPVYPHFLLHFTHFNLVFATWSLSWRLL
ncbi:unnamed protein product [Protopolystoma xenopodis]|uniref:Uncharacterized protein n=1 Tax=Protopolystoma xenopodis TaxID=117903 RepID=A0A448WMJ4_9PLAT|nr:unnamed protein product [Protopolystoma xenopodis]